MTPAGGRPAQEGGAAMVELVVLTPVLMALLLFMVLAGRVVVATGELDAAARDGARAASLSRSPAAAVRAGQEAASADLAQTRRVACRSLAVQVNTAGFRPRQTPTGPAAGTVTVSVRCQLQLADLALGLPGTRLVERRATAPVDAFREVT